MIDEDEEFERDLEDWDDEDPDSEDLDAVSYVCEDCDYRWDDMAGEDFEVGSVVCPMCGSVNVTQL